MTLGPTIETLAALGDESRLRLCLLLADRELNVSDLVRVTGMAQSRVSTHLGRLRDAGLVHDRRHGAHSFYTLASDALSATATTVLEEARATNDPTLLGDQERLAEVEAQRRDGGESTDEVERYSPGRTWRSLAVGIAALLELGDVLDVGSGDAAAASMLAPYCRSLTCVDTNERAIAAAKERFTGQKHVVATIADAEALPFDAASFDTVVLFHTLTHTEHPKRALAECVRVLRPSGRVVVLCLDAHRHRELTSRYGELHPGFSPQALRTLLTDAGLHVRSSEVASRESKKPHLQVVLAIAEKARRSSVPSDKSRSSKSPRSDT